MSEEPKGLGAAFREANDVLSQRNRASRVVADRTATVRDYA